MSNVVEYLKEDGRFEKMTVTEVFTEIVESYIGTCDAMEDEDQDFISENDLESLMADEMFLCECCNWWCPVEELADHEGYERLCTDCVDDQEED